MLADLSDTRYIVVSTPVLKPRVSTAVYNMAEWPCVIGGENDISEPGVQILTIP